MSRAALPLDVRLENGIAKSTPDACWEWQRQRNWGGYGRLTLPNQRKILAHRLAWELEFGPIPDGLWVLHRCDNPPCCNPAHLFLGTTLDNTRDMDAKGRRRTRSIKAEWTHCPRGHEFTKENTIITKDGRRRCRECHNARRRNAWSTA
jgi:HNH endonuclease